MQRLMRANAGQVMSQSALAGGLNSKVRPKGAMWVRLLQRLEELGVVQIEKSSTGGQMVRLVSWKEVTEANLFERSDVVMHANNKPR